MIKEKMFSFHLLIHVRLRRNILFWSDGTCIVIIPFAEGIPLEVCKCFFMLGSVYCLAVVIIDHLYKIILNVNIPHYSKKSKWCA